MRLTKDTVLESLIPNKFDARVTWNDSVSLINTSRDTVVINAVYFITPKGKDAQLQIGWNMPYKKDGYISGPVLWSNQTYRFFLDSDKMFLPGSRVLITGFRMETCIECPVSGGGSTNGHLDTISTFVVFETKFSRDTLVVIGDIESVSTAIQQPLAGHLRFRDRENKSATKEIHFFNGLGKQIDNDNQAILFGGKK